MTASSPIRPWLWLGALTVVACSGGAETPAQSGSLSLALEIGGRQVDEARYVITRDETVLASGTIDVSAPGATASVEVFGLPAGNDYLVTLTATTVDGELSCTGSAEFAVEVGVATPVMVFLNCKAAQELGGARVNGKFNFCAQLTHVVVSPLQTSVRNDITLSAGAQDVEGDDIRYVWSATGGSISPAVAENATFTCTRAGNYSIRIEVADDPGCSDEWEVAVRCVEGTGEPECVVDEDCERLSPTECVEPPTCTARDNTCEIGAPLPEGSPCLRGSCGSAGICTISQCATDAGCAAWRAPNDCMQPYTCEVRALNPYGSACIPGAPVAAGTPCEGGTCDGNGECLGSNVTKSEAVRVACRNSITADRSTLPAHLTVTPPSEWKDDPSATDFWTIGGEAIFDKAFLDRAQLAIEGGVKTTRLLDLRWTVSLRSGGTMADVPLGAAEFPYTCALDRGTTCDPSNDLPGAEGRRGNTDCLPTGASNPCGPFVDIPTSDDCGPGGLCQVIDAGTGVEAEQCRANGFCVSEPLRIPLEPQRVEITPNAPGVDLVFGWYETNRRNPDGTIALPPAAFSDPLGPIGFRSTDGDLGIALECVLGGGAGWTFNGPYPVPDSALLTYTIPSE